MKFKLLAFFISAIGLASCVDIPDFDSTPKIYYNGITQYTDVDTLGGQNQEYEMVVISIDVEDGEGDLGATPEEYNDTSFVEKYVQRSGWELPANYELVTMTKQPDGSFDEKILTADSLKFFPMLTSGGKPGPIKAKLDLYTKYFKSSSSKLITCKYKVRIIDRALNISNSLPEPTDEVTVPSL